MLWKSASESSKQRARRSHATGSVTARLRIASASAVAACYTENGRILPPNADIVEGRAAIEAFGKEFISNWNEYDGPAAKKFALAAKNLALRVKLQGCCGHDGEPGC